MPGLHPSTHSLTIIVNLVLQNYVDGIWSNLTLLANLQILKIVAVQGIARGGGAELAAALDIRFASKEKAIFAQIEVTCGQVPGGVVCHCCLD
jgi:enoyl-CoA hydratase/carnithine racemase